MLPFLKFCIRMYMASSNATKAKKSLLLQQSSLGEDNEITEQTLRLIATCLMNIGEDFFALVALEEAMYIRMQNFKKGNNEAATIATDVWTLLHKNRIPQEGTPDRVYLLKGMKSQENKNGQISFNYYSSRSLVINKKEYEDDDLYQVDLNDSTYQ